MNIKMLKINKGLHCTGLVRGPQSLHWLIIDTTIGTTIELQPAIEKPSLVNKGIDSNDMHHLCLKTYLLLEG